MYFLFYLCCTFKGRFAGLVGIMHASSYWKISG